MGEYQCCKNLVKIRPLSIKEFKDPLNNLSIDPIFGPVFCKVSCETVQNFPLPHFIFACKIELDQIKELKVKVLGI